MKFNDLVFLAEMDYSQIPGEHSQAVRDATLGEEPGEGEARYRLLPTGVGGSFYVDPPVEGDWMIDERDFILGGKHYIVYYEFRDKDVNDDSDGFFIKDDANTRFFALEVHPDKSLTEVTDPGLIESLKGEAFDYYLRNILDIKDYKNRRSPY